MESKVKRLIAAEGWYIKYSTEFFDKRYREIVYKSHTKRVQFSDTSMMLLYGFP